MISPVIIKGNNMGIHLIMSKDASIDMILSDLKKKLNTTKHYYKNVRPISLTFDGRDLTEDEVNQITNILSDNGLIIKTKETIPEQPIAGIDDSQLDKDGLFLIGNIRNGQSIDATKSIIIIGDVERGASVYSKGNIIVIGQIYGNVVSESCGSKKGFIYSLDVNNQVSRRNY